MLIEDRDGFDFDVTEIDLAGVEGVSVAVKEKGTGTPLGELRIAKNKSQAFGRSLQDILREVHDIFQENLKPSAHFDNKSSGTVNFVEE